MSLPPCLFLFHFLGFFFWLVRLGKAIFPALPCTGKAQLSQGSLAGMWTLDFLDTVSISLSEKKVLQKDGTQTMLQCTSKDS